MRIRFVLRHTVREVIVLVGAEAHRILVLQIEALFLFELSNFYSLHEYLLPVDDSGAHLVEVEVICVAVLIFVHLSRAL